MSLRRVSAVTVLVTAASLLASPAFAQRTTVADPAGDASGPGLDIVSATLRNGEHAVVARVGFVEATRGDLIVSVAPRHGPGVRLVSEYRPHHTTRSFVLGGSFRLHADGGGRCPAFRVTWDADTEVAKLRMPARCLAGGDYGALRFALLTELGDDTDYAPQTAGGSISSTEWVPRG